MSLGLLYYLERAKIKVLYKIQNISFAPLKVFYSFCLVVSPNPILPMTFSPFFPLPSLSWGGKKINQLIIFIMLSTEAKKRERGREKEIFQFDKGSERDKTELPG